jgi:endonuclease/exonuclease/phosphatase family metal-dependent hydrolase
MEATDGNDGNDDDDGNDGSERVTKRAGAVRALLRLLALASTVLLGLALLGYVARDRTRWLALLMYLPLVVVAAVTIAAQLLAFERGRWVRRVAVIVVAFVAGVTSLRDMYQGGYVGGQQGATRIVQWNVQWGRDDAGWEETARQIAAAKPDVVILSEAPSDEKLAALRAQLGEPWTVTVARNPRGSRYWYAIAVMSRWPMSDVSDVPLPNGAVREVTLASPAGPLRVLAVDGMSRPTISRTPLLAAVAGRARARDVDIVAGDFNAVSRSVGFDALRAAGFRLASGQCRGWRGTYPAKLPLYDIDHVWVGGSGGHDVGGCDLLDSPGTNHRGQVAYIHPRAAAW